MERLRGGVGGVSRRPVRGWRQISAELCLGGLGIQMKVPWLCGKRAGFAWWSHTVITGLD